MKTKMMPSFLKIGYRGEGHEYNNDSLYHLKKMIIPRQKIFTDFEEQREYAYASPRSVRRSSWVPKKPVRPVTTTPKPVPAPKSVSAPRVTEPRQMPSESMGWGSLFRKKGTTPKPAAAPKPQVQVQTQQMPSEMLNQSVGPNFKGLMSGMKGAFGKVGSGIKSVGKDIGRGAQAVGSGIKSTGQKFGNWLNSSELNSMNIQNPLGGGVGNTGWSSNVRGMGSRSGGIWGLYAASDTTEDSIYLQREFSRKKHPSMKEYRESLKSKDYEDLVNDGMDNFSRTVDHGAISVLDSVAGQVLINSAVRHAKGGKKKTAAILGTLGAVEGLAAGAHAKAAISHGKASRAAKLEIRRRRREKKDKRN